MTERGGHSIVARAVSLFVFVSFTIWPAHARGAGRVRLKPEQVTTLHVGQTAAVQFGGKTLHTIGSGGGSLVLIQQLTNKDGGKVYVYRAAHAGPDTLVATPVGRKPGQCISCVTRHYFINVVP